MDHVRELQGRLSIVALSFLVVAGSAYPFFDRIAAMLTAPLGGHQQLVYLTPGGAFGFIIQVCMYIGIIGALPVIVHQFYRFILPAIPKARRQGAIIYTISSIVLAMVGVVFAYVVSLPAALYFLTSFNLQNISAMLTIDSYLSFVMTYLLAGAILFQLPLVMLIIDTITPLTPRRLMQYQSHVVVGSFVVAAVISPTPDAWNQTLLASPMVVMYQLGIVLIWARSRSRRPQHQAIVVPAVSQLSQPAEMPAVLTTFIEQQSRQLNGSLQDMRTTPSIERKQPGQVRSMDGLITIRKRVHVPPRQHPAVAYRGLAPSLRRRSIDGFYQPVSPFNG
jgi:sec-independent protein translocase protein TatC